MFCRRKNKYRTLDVLKVLDVSEKITTWRVSVSEPTKESTTRTLFHVYTWSSDVRKSTEVLSYDTCRYQPGYCSTWFSPMQHMGSENGWHIDPLQPFWSLLTSLVEPCRCHVTREVRGSVVIVSVPVLSPTFCDQKGQVLRPPSVRTHGKGWKSLRSLNYLYEL